MLEIAFRRINAVAVLDLNGTIDIDSANFVGMVQWCLENGYKDILCNFENVSMVDYAGLSVLAISHKDVMNHQGRIKLANVSAYVNKVFCLVYLDRVFEIYSDEKTALQSFEEDRVISEIQKKHLRRRCKRLPLDVTIEFKAVGESVYSCGKLLNISGVGMLVFAEKIYPLEEILTMRLTLSPKPGLVEIEGKVVWLVQKELQPQIYPAMGIEFHNLSAEMQEHIIEFVERNLSLNCSSDD
jgi:anti-sigma B factor antagonist